MPVGLATAAITAIPALIKAGQGIAQKRAAKKIKPKDREIAQEYKDLAKKKASMAFSSKKTGQDRAEEKIEGKYSNALKQATRAATSNRFMQEVSKAASTSADKISDLENEASKDKMKREEARDNETRDMGDRTQNLTDSVRDEKIAQKAALKDAGNQNLYGAAEAGSSIALGAMATKGMSDEERRKYLAELALKNRKTNG